MVGTGTYSRSIGYSLPGTCSTKHSQLQMFTFLKQNLKNLLKVRPFLSPHLNDRGVVKVPREELDVDGGRHEDEFEVWPAVD